MLHIYGATDRGMVRETNEDRFAGEVFDQGSGYAVVCDGMGGEVGGGIAAGIAAEEVRRMIESSLRSHMEERSLRLLLETAIAGANRAVYTRSGQSGGALTGMGSTLCAAVISDGVALVANVGDSRCYLLRQGELIQVTEPHRGGGTAAAGPAEPRGSRPSPGPARHYQGHRGGAGVSSRTTP